MKTPELNKIKEVHEKSQSIGIFLDWLGSKDIVLCKRHEHNEGCKFKDEIECGFQNFEYLADMTGTEKLLAEYFEIDLKKAENERFKILESIRK